MPRCTLLLLLAAACLLATQHVLAQSSCTPSSCAPKCNPGCSSNQVCTLGTMKECGVCPASKCVDRSVLGLPPLSPSATDTSASTPTDGSSADGATDGGGGTNKGALIGGIVGGLLGGLALFTAVGCLVVRRYKHKKNLLPFASALRTNYNSTAEKTPNTTRQITSGVIPVTYIPPPAENHRSSRHLSVADYDSDGESATTRSSMASTADHPATPSKTSYAVAVSRARPQIMRVNQIQVPSIDGLSRSSSVRTVLTREANLTRSNTAPARRVKTPPTPLPRPVTMLNPDQPSTSLAPPYEGTDDDPFHDRHSISVEDLPTPPPLPPKTSTDSRVLGDGEITIYWNADQQQQEQQEHASTPSHSKRAST